MTETRQPWWLWPLLVILLPFVVVVGVLWLVTAVLLQLVVWLTWCPRGRYVLVVYSNSPIWREYFEAHVLPAVSSRGVVLNWSERKQWPYSLPVALFKLFAGTRNFNPMAIVLSHLPGLAGSPSTPPSKRSSMVVLRRSRKCGISFSRSWTVSRHLQVPHDVSSG